MEISSGKVYEITDNTVIIIEVDQHLHQQQIIAMQEHCNNHFSCPVHIFAKGIRVKVLNNEAEPCEKYKGWIDASNMDTKADHVALMNPDDHNDVRVVHNSELEDEDS